jgi:hypothetical protein
MAIIRRRGTVIRGRRRIVAAALATIVVLLAAAGAGTRLRPVPHPSPAVPAPPMPRVTLGTLKPGSYHDALLRPPVTFTLPPGTTWRAGMITTDTLALADDPDGVTFAIQRWTTVHDPITTGASATRSTKSPQAGSDSGVSARPDDIIAWLAAHPALHITDPARPSSLAGKPAHRISFTLRPGRVLPRGPASGCPRAQDCLVLADSPDNPVVIYSDDTITVIAADHEPTGPVITVQTPTTDRARLTPVSESIIGTLR